MKPEEFLERLGWRLTFLAAQIFTPITSVLFIIAIELAINTLLLTFILLALSKGA